MRWRRGVDSPPGEPGGPGPDQPNRAASGAVVLLYAGVLGSTYAAATDAWSIGLIAGGALAAGMVLLYIVFR